MLAVQIISCVFVSIALIGIYGVLSHKNKKIPLIAFKILSLILAGIFFLRFMLDYDALDKVLKLTNSPIDGKLLTVISIVINMCLQPTILLVIIYPFFKNRNNTTLVKFWALPIALLSFIFIKPVTMGIVGADAYDSFNIRFFLMGMKIAVLIAYTFVIFMENKRFKLDKKDAICFAYILPMILFGMMTYVPKALFGYANNLIEVDGFSQWHRIFLYFLFIVPILIHFSLKNCKYETKKFALLLLSIEALFVFLDRVRFPECANVETLPLHLCHTAMYILPICLLFNLNKVFYFTYFINVLGAFFAMAMPNYDDGLNVIASSMLRFWSNHYFAFFMPLLFVSLKMFKRPKLKEFIYSTIAFTAYFVVILFANTYFTELGHATDYFYINSDFIAYKLGVWAENLRNVTSTIRLGNVEMVLYPLYKSIYWAVYVLFSAIMWFLYELIYNFTDSLNDIAKRRKKYKQEQLALMSELDVKILKMM